MKSLDKLYSLKYILLGIGFQLGPSSSTLEPAFHHHLASTVAVWSASLSHSFEGFFYNSLDAH